MSQKLYEESNIQAIANAIRAKNGTTTKYKTSDMASAIQSLTGNESGIDTSDATASAGDIANGKTAYVNGQKVTGSVTTYNSSSSSSTESDSLQDAGTYLKVLYTFIADRLFRKNSKIELKVDYTNFGDATAEDVVAGKTFTSAAGLKVTGTGSGGSSGGIQKKEGSVTIESQCEAFTIETGLSVVHTIIVQATAGSDANTYSWTYDDGGRSLNGCAARSSYLTTHSTGNKITVDGGTVTCNQVSSSYPILPKTFNWVAYGE